MVTVVAVVATVVAVDATVVGAVVATVVWLVVGFVVGVVVVAVVAVVVDVVDDVVVDDSVVVEASVVLLLDDVVEASVVAVVADESVVVAEESDDVVIPSVVTVVVPSTSPFNVVSEPDGCSPLPELASMPGEAGSVIETEVLVLPSATSVLPSRLMAQKPTPTMPRKASRPSRIGPSRKRSRSSSGAGAIGGAAVGPGSDWVASCNSGREAPAVAEVAIAVSGNGRAERLAAAGGAI